MAFATRYPGVKITNVELGAVGGMHGGSWARARVFVKPGLGDKLTAGSQAMVPAVEWIASRLALALGLPTPTGQVGELTDEGATRKVWVSMAVSLECGVPAPPDPAEIVAAEPVLAAGTFVFDTWIYNSDRHDENLIYHKTLGLWLIDHDQSLGVASADTLTDLAGFDDRSLARHCFRGLPLQDRHVARWIQAIQSFPMLSLEGIIDSGYRAGIYTKPYGEGIVRFLKARRAILTDLVRRSRGVGTSTAFEALGASAEPGLDLTGGEGS